MQNNKFKDFFSKMKTGPYSNFSKEVQQSLKRTLIFLAVAGCLFLAFLIISSMTWN
jgi:hypothetical protein